MQRLLKEKEAGVKGGSWFESEMKYGKLESMIPGNDA